MSAKVFDELLIYNIFPTETGADIIKSREIASQKMYLIHNALGEDAKIFDSDEEPTASGLFTRINQNPDNDEYISIETKIRNLYHEIKETYPEVIARVEKLPNRTKTGKRHTIENTVIVRKKGLALFYISDTLNQDKHQTQEITLEELISHITCTIDEPRVSLDKPFWESYEIGKKFIPKHRSGARNIKSLEQKAVTALKDLLKNHKELLDPQQIEFVNTLIYDIRKYKTLPDYTLRRLSLSGKKDEYATLVENIKDLQARLKNNYLEKIRERASAIKDDVIIAVRNIVWN
jgi:hypothetical protein